MTTTPPRALTIAGSDSGGSAGLQADLRTFFACGVHGTTAVTAVTVQDSVQVRATAVIPADTVADQIRVVATDIGVQAVKTGMLATTEIISAVAATCRELGIGRDGTVPLVVDPVSATRYGQPLLPEEAMAALRSELIPLATVVTPNLDEVRLLTGAEVRTAADQRAAAVALAELGPRWVLVTGGHLEGDPDCVDLLDDGQELVELPAPRITTRHTHGAGDTLAAAITAALARGMEVPAAVRFAKRFVTRSVRHAYPLGAGTGPVSAFWRLGDEDCGEPV